MLPVVETPGGVEVFAVTKQGPSRPASKNEMTVTKSITSDPYQDELTGQADHRNSLSQQHRGLTLKHLQPGIEGGFLQNSAACKPVHDAKAQPSLFQTTQPPSYDAGCRE